jgi:hypothetical protein
MSTLTVGTLQSNTTSPPAVTNSGGTQIGTFCRAWVNFNGTGTVAIRASFNVSSITDNGAGNFTVNMASAMTDTSYCSVVTVGGDRSGAIISTDIDTAGSLLAKTTTAYSINARTSAGSQSDMINVQSAVFR